MAVAMSAASINAFDLVVLQNSFASNIANKLTALNYSHAFCLTEMYSEIMQDFIKFYEPLRNFFFVGFSVSEVCVCVYVCVYECMYVYVYRSHPKRTQERSIWITATMPRINLYKNLKCNKRSRFCD